MASVFLNATTTEEEDRLPPYDGLGSAVLVHNVRWFIRVRWVIVAVMLLAGAVSRLLPSLVTLVGLATPCSWTWMLAAVLALANVLFWLLAANFYLLSVCLEILGWWTRTGVALPSARHLHNPDLSLLLALSAVFVWLVVWYLVSTLSKIVKDRDRLLESANQRLLAADEEKNRIMQASGSP